LYVGEGVAQSRNRKEVYEMYVRREHNRERISLTNSLKD